MLDLMAEATVILKIAILCAINNLMLPLEYLARRYFYKKTNRIQDAFQGLESIVDIANFISVSVLAFMILTYSH